MTDWINRCHFGDVRDVLRQMAADGVKVNCIVTSPPYWGLRSYLPEGHPDKPHEIGSEPTLREFIATLTEVFDLAREILADDGTCFVNMGDAYAGDRGAAWGPSPSATAARAMTDSRRRDNHPIPRSDARVAGLKPKDLMGQPWRLAFALQDAGWWLRQEIIWNKPNPMPESVRDRCTKAHEHIFLLTKSERYFWDFEGSQEPASAGTHARLSQASLAEQAGSARANGGTRSNRPMKAVGNGVGFGHGYDKNPKPRAVKTPAGWATGTDRKHDEVLGRYTEHRRSGKYGDLTGGDDDGVHRTKAGLNLPTPKAALATTGNDGAYVDGKSGRTGRGPGWRVKNNASMDEALAVMPLVRNPRSVWTIPTQSYKGSHFATFPEALVERCLIPGCPPGGTVLDIFMGSGTTGQVAQRLGMNWIGIDLDLRNEALQRERIGGQAAFTLEKAA